jgi:putative membrane protein insertion efficiency factor
MKHICMAIIRFYRRFLSRLKPTPTCRFTPTCSAYALEAFEKRGFFVGFALMIWRILRCSPLSPCGYDPVPLHGFKTMPMRWSKYDRPKTDGDDSAPTDESES